MKRMYLTRHGQTDWNIERRFQGRSNTQINEAGRDQAEKLGKRLKDYSIQKVFSSPAKRTLETANIITSNRNIPIVTDDRLMEIDLGNWEGLLFNEIEQQYPEENYNFWNKPEIFAEESIEPFENVMSRTKSFVKDLALSTIDEFLVVSHGITIRSLLSIWDNRTIKTFWEGAKIFKQCSLTIVEFDKNLDGKILFSADESHL